MSVLSVGGVSHGSVDFVEQIEPEVKEAFQPASAGRLIIDLVQVNQCADTGEVGTARRMLEAIQRNAASYVAFPGKEAVGSELLDRICVDFDIELRKFDERVKIVAQQVIFQPVTGSPDAEAHAALHRCFHGINEGRYPPAFQHDGSWAIERFVPLAYKLGVAVNEDVLAKGIARYNGLVPEESRISDPVNGEENVRYPYLMFYCLGDEILALMQRCEVMDSKLSAAACFFGILNTGINFVSETIWEQTRMQEAAAHEGDKIFMTLQRALPCTLVPHVDNDANWKISDFLTLGQALKGVLEKDVLSLAFAEYNRLVPMQVLIPSTPMSSDETVRFPGLLYECFRDVTICLVSEGERRDVKVDAVMRFFQIKRIHGPVLESESTWNQIKMDCPSLAREELFYRISVVRAVMSKRFEKIDALDLIALDESVRVVDFHEFMEWLNAASSSDLRKVAFEKYNALVPEKYRVENPATDMEAAVIFPATLYACLQEALKEFSEGREEELSLDCETALRFFQDYPSNGKKEEVQKAAMEEIDRPVKFAFDWIYGHCLEKVEREMQWGCVSNEVLQLGKLLGSDELPALVLARYTASTGQAIKGFDAIEQEIAYPAKLRNAITTIVGEVTLKSHNSSTDSSIPPD